MYLLQSQQMVEQILTPKKQKMTRSVYMYLLQPQQIVEQILTPKKQKMTRIENEEWHLLNNGSFLLHVRTTATSNGRANADT